MQPSKPLRVMDCVYENISKHVIPTKIHHLGKVGIAHTKVAISGTEQAKVNKAVLLRYPPKTPKHFGRYVLLFFHVHGHIYQWPHVLL